MKKAVTHAHNFPLVCSCPGVLDAPHRRSARRSSITVSRVATLDPSTVGLGLDSDSPQAIALKDVNRDLKDDILAVDSIDDKFLVYLNDGNGNFPANPKEFGTGAGPLSITTGNFNSDAFPDVVVVNGDDDSVTVQLGDGQGNFSVPRDYPVDFGPVAVVAADFNGDGLDDLAVLSDFTVYLLKSNGDGTFTPFPIASIRTKGSGGFAIAAGFFGTDNKADLVTSNNASDNISIFLGNGDGSFQSAILKNVIAAPQDIVVADLNNDGFADVGVVSGIDVDAGVSLFFGHSDATFDDEVRTTAEVSSIAVAAADLDHDGKTDLLVTNSSGDVGIGVDILCQQPSQVCVAGGTRPPPTESGFQLSPLGVAFRSDKASQ